MIEVTPTLRTNTDLTLTLCLSDLHYVQIHSQPQCTVIVCVRIIICIYSIFSSFFHPCTFQ